MNRMERQLNIFESLYKDEAEPVVVPIDYRETEPFILGIHYARRMPCIQYAFGLIVKGVLCGVVTYGQPASPTLCIGIAGERNRKNVLELNRLCFLPDYNGDNYASILVSHSLKMLPNHTFVVSYADWGGVEPCRLRLPSNKLSVYGINKSTFRRLFGNWTFTALHKGRNAKASEDRKAQICLFSR